MYKMLFINQIYMSTCPQLEKNRKRSLGKIFLRKCVTSLHVFRIFSANFDPLESRQIDIDLGLQSFCTILEYFEILGGFWGDFSLYLVEKKGLPKNRTSLMDVP